MCDLTRLRLVVNGAVIVRILFVEGASRRHHHDVPILALLQPQSQFHLPLFVVLRIRVLVPSLRAARCTIVTRRHITRLVGPRWTANQKTSWLRNEVRRQGSAPGRAPVVCQNVLDAERIDDLPAVVRTDIDVSDDAIATATAVAANVDGRRLLDLTATSVHRFDDVEPQRRKEVVRLAADQIPRFFSAVEVPQFAQSLVDGFAGEKERERKDVYITFVARVSN